MQPLARLAASLGALSVLVLVTGSSAPLLPRTTSAGSTAQVRLNPLSQRVSWANGPVTIRVVVSDVNHHGQIGYDDDRDTVPDRFQQSNGLAAYELRIRYNPGVVRVTDVQAGAILRQGGRAAQCLDREQAAGDYRVGCISLGSSDGPQGAGTLAVITLRPLANGASFLTLGAVLAGPLADDIPVRIANHGVIAVFGAPREAPPWEPPPDSGGGGGGGLNVIDGGTPGALDAPDGYDLRGAGSNSGNPVAEGVETDGSGPDGASAEGYPSAGGGFHQQTPAIRPLVLGGTLALLGAVCLLAAASLSRRNQRM